MIVVLAIIAYFVCGLIGVAVVGATGNSGDGIEPFVFLLWPIAVLYLLLTGFASLFAPGKRGQKR